MEKINCDIIQDLIPSYVDQVCSEATKYCVEEHIETCKECKKMEQFYRNHMFSGKEIEKRELDGLKKIRKIMNLQKIISYVLLGLTGILGIWLFGINYLIVEAYCLWFVICMIGILLVSMISRHGRKPEKKQYLVGIFSLAADVYMVSMTFYILKTLSMDKIPFGLEPHECGPFLERQIIVVFILQIIFLFYHLIYMAKYEMDCSTLSGIDMIGIFLMLGTDISLRTMSADYISDFLEITMITIFIGLIGVIGSVMIKKWKK